MAEGKITEAQEKQLREVARVDNLEQIDKRRKDVETEKGKEKRIHMRDYTQEVGFQPLPADLHDHKHCHVLLSVTGPGYRRPACPYTGLCIMAAFGDNEDGSEAMRAATAFAKRRIIPNFEGADIRSVLLDKWFLIASTPEKMADEVYCMTAMQTNMDRYYDQLRNNQRNFVSKVEDVTDTREQQLEQVRKDIKELEKDLEAAIRDADADAAEIVRLEKQLATMQASQTDAGKKNAKRKHKRVLEELRGREDADAIAKIKEHEAALEDLDNAVKSHKEEFNAIGMMIETLSSKNPARIRERIAAARETEAKLEAELEHPETKRKLLERKLENKRKAEEAKRIAKDTLKKRTGQEQMEIMGTASNKDPAFKSSRTAMKRTLVRQNCKDYEALLPFPQEIIPRSQQFANICYLPDTSKEARSGKKDAEPMVRILRFYNSVEAAERDAEERLSRYIGDFDIQTVDVGEWLFPGDVDYDEQENFKYRDQEQNRLMQSRKREKKKVRNYEQLCADADMTVDEVFIKEAEEGLSAEDYYKQMQIEGNVAEQRRSLAAASMEGDPV